VRPATKTCMPSRAKRLQSAPPSPTSGPTPTTIAFVLSLMRGPSRLYESPHAIARYLAMEAAATRSVASPRRAVPRTFERLVLRRPCRRVCRRGILLPGGATRRKLLLAALLLRRGVVADAPRLLARARVLLGARHGSPPRQRWDGPTSSRLLYIRV